MTDTKKLLLDATGARSIREIAQAIGMEPSTLHRQAKDLPVKTTVAICRAYDVPVVPLFVHLGYITAAEAVSGSLRESLETASDAQLMAEVLRRVHTAEATGAITAPVDVSAVSDDDLRDMSEDRIRENYATAAGDDESVDPLEMP